jgi:hypothetical protein
LSGFPQQFHVLRILRIAERLNRFLDHKGQGALFFLSGLMSEDSRMQQQQWNRSVCAIGKLGAAMTSLLLVVGGAACFSGCGGEEGGMVPDAKESSKTPDAQDSMKAYMKQMQSKGMKPGMKPAAKS